MQNKIKEFREKLKLTQEELARKALVSRTTISGLENGDVKVITNLTMEKISNALGKKVKDVFFLQ